MVYAELGANRKALEYFDQSLAIVRALKDFEGQASTLDSIGAVRLSMGNREAALEAFAQAMGLWRTVGDPAGEARSLKGMAQVESDRGNLTEALGKIEAALKIVESMRTKIDEGGLRASYLGATKGYYEFCVDLLPCVCIVSTSRRTTPPPRFKPMNDLAPAR